MMANVRELRRGLLVLVIVLVAIDVVGIGVFLSPLAARGKRIQEYQRVRRDYEEKARVAIPLRNMDQKLEQARQQIADFYQDRLPARDSAIAEEIGKVANKANVRFSGIRYEVREAALPGLQLLEMNVTLAGDYPDLVRFINTLERDPMFFLIDRVTLAEQQGGAVRLELRLETYLRQPSAPQVPTKAS